MVAPSRAAPRLYSTSGLWPNRTLHSFVAERAAESPRSLAVVDGAMRLDYGELNSLIQLTAVAFRGLGVRHDDVVTVDLPNWWEAVVTVQAALRAGAAANPVIPIYREREVGFILRQGRPRVVVVPHHFRGLDYVSMMSALLEGVPERPTVVVVRSSGDLPRGFLAFETLLDEVRARGAEEIADVGGPDDIALLMYTSGTTADPKGVLHNHRTLCYENRSIIDLFRLGADDTVFMPSPLTHITGFLYGIALPPMLGVPSVLLDVWDPGKAAELIQSESCRFTVAATPFLRGLTDAYGDLGERCALHSFLCGGADVPPELIYRSREVLGSTVVRVYGSSEFPTFSSGCPDDPPDIGAETDGMPIGPVQFRIDNPDVSGVGELLLRGPELFLGYLDAELNVEAFTHDGYFRSGDLASVDAHGAVTIRGRSKDIIIRNGENISAKEIEDLLHEHPKIQEAVIVAMPDPKTGERVCAFVVPVVGATIELSEVCEYLVSRQIARQKLPEWLEVIEDVPTTASGKIQKFLLRDRARDLASSA